jgi:uncharacterized membrane protein YkvA (DUF1232 family)
MSLWKESLIVLAAAIVSYGVLVVVLVLAGRGEQARTLARFVPDCVVLFKGLLSDTRLPRARKLLLLALLAYLAMPIDLIPDFIPVAGQLDDAILVALGLRTVLRGASGDLVREHWPGPDASLHVVLRLAGARPAGA